MPNLRDPKPDRLEKAVGCLFVLTGGLLGIAIGWWVSYWVVAPIVAEMYYVKGSKLSGLFEVGFASLVFTVGSGLTGLISFSYFELKRRK